jgi:predicted dehydrogenase
MAGEAGTRKIGLSGCGAIGRLHARNLAQRGVELRFHNRTRAKAEDFAGHFGGEVCDTFSELVDKSDAVVISTPPESHAEQAINALAAGIPVMVEKPLCVSEDELDRIEEAAAAGGDDVFVMVAENYYYKPSVALLREIIAWDGVGVVESMQVKKLTQQEAVSWKAGYGALMEGGIHFVAQVSDLADAALGGRQEPAPVRTPVDVKAEFPTVEGGGPERRSRLMLSYEGGLEVHMLYAWDVPSWTKGTFQHSRIDGSAGRILFESNGIYVHVRGPGRKGLSFPGLADLMGYGAMTDDFLLCVASREAEPYSSLRRARRDLVIVLKAYEQLP